MSRKGDAIAGAILGIIIFGVVAIILILLYNTIFSFTKSEFTQKECQTSLLLTRGVDSAKAGPACLIEGNPVPLKCSRRYLTVTDEGADNSIGFRDYDEACPAGVQDPDGNCMPQNAIANEMAYCWQTFFEGEQVVFQQMEVSNAKLLSAKGPVRTCFVCGEVTLKTRQDIENFTAYVQAAKYEDGTGGTYYDYFNTRKSWCDREYRENGCWNEYAADEDNGKVIGFFPDGKAIDQERLRTGQKYAVVFIRKGMGTCDKDPEARGILSYPLTNTIQVIPADDIARYCTAVIA